MSATATAAPASASRSAVAWPMPLPPPVTTATRPSNDHSSDRAESVKSGIMSGPPRRLRCARRNRTCRSRPAGLDGHADRVGAWHVSGQGVDSLPDLVEAEGVGIGLGDQAAVALDQAAGPLEGRVIGGHRTDDGDALVNELVGDQAGDRLAPLEPDQHDPAVL